MSGQSLDLDQKLASIIPRMRASVRDDVSRPRHGRVLSITGVVIHATIEEARLGELCELVDPRSDSRIRAEVVGLKEDAAVLVPLGDMTGLSSLTEVVATGHQQQVAVGPGLLGRVISAFGEPLDGRPLDPSAIAQRYDVNAYPLSPLERQIISEPIQLGIRALDGMLTCAKGQRVGIFGEPGVGKSVLLSDIVSGTDADVAVIALVGERGREVREFVERQLSPEGLQKSVIVVATSDRPAIERVKAAYVATSIAEYFRDCGKSVLLAMDNVTRFARAQREIGLASGEPPTRRGFPASLFAVLPRLLERAGPGPDGSITGLYNVLVEGDGTLDPVAEEIRALLDGHIVLSAELAQRDHFPAIDVLRSRSRLMEAIVDAEHRDYASRLRALLARYSEVEILLRVGEYRKGADPLADEAVAKIDRIHAFLRQAPGSRETIGQTKADLAALIGAAYE